MCCFIICKQDDGYRDTGCYNFDCPGFVPINQHFAVGAAAQSVSTLDGRQATIWKVDIIRAIFIICGVNT